MLSDKEQAYRTLSKNVAPNLRSQIAKMHQRDSLSVEEIATALSLPVMLIQAVVFWAAPKKQTVEGDGLALKTKDEVDSEYQELLGRARSLEDRFADAEDAAINTLVELNETSESEAVRYNSAKTILEIRAGKLRPERPNKQTTGGITPADMQQFIQQAMAVHAAALARSGEAAMKNATPVVDLQAVEICSQP